MPSTTVIVPIYNGMAHLPAFFESLAAALPTGSQVILVDDGSVEPVFSTVPDFGRAEEVVQMRNDRTLGYCVTANRAFEIATGEVIVQLNTDLVLERDCITAMIDLIEREQNVGIVGSKLLYPTTGLVQHIGMALGDYSHCHIYRDLPADHALCTRTREMQLQTGATAAMSRRVLDQIGPLDEAFFNANDDLDHCLQARELGFRNFTCAESIAHHWESRSGPARFAGVKPAEALFWARWSGRHDVDLGRFVDEALDHVVEQDPRLASAPLEILDLSRGGDQPIILDRLSQRWPGIGERVRAFRQFGNDAPDVHLPLVLPHWVAAEPTPFIYVVDRYRTLAENTLWFENRRRVVADELVVDLTGVVIHTSEAFPCR